MSTRSRSRILLFFLAASAAFSQTTLSSGVAVRFALPASAQTILLNGTAGYRIAIDADTSRLVVTLDTLTPGVDLDLYVRCGSDVALSSNSVVADGSNTGDDSRKKVILYRPLNGAAGTCYIAFDQRTKGIASVGRLTATAETLPEGTRVTVPAIAQTYLAGQPNGTPWGAGVSTPQNAAIAVPVPLTGGQGLRIAATGNINIDATTCGTAVGPNGSTHCQENVTASTTGIAAGLSSLSAPVGGLTGVFLGPSAPSRFADRPDPLSFWDNGIHDLDVVRPLLQQPFWIGDGYTPDGHAKTFVIPAGATRLFLGSGRDAVNRNTGSFLVSVASVAVPPVEPHNPIAVPSIAQTYLAGQPDGVGWQGSTSTPMNRPPQASIPVTPGQTLHIVANGVININALGCGTNVGPTGSKQCTENVTTNGSGDIAGMSALRAPIGALSAVFLGTNPPSRLADRPPALDFSGGLRDEVKVSPLIQQPFMVGDGYTPSGQLKSFVVPAGATRLFLGVHRLATDQDGPVTGADQEDVGRFYATVSVDQSGVPVIAGIRNGAGFDTGSLSAGSIASIFGSGFGALASADAVPLPVSISDTTVLFNGIAAPLYFVSPEQINAQIPYELEGRTSALVTVVVKGVAGVPVKLALGAVQPGIFTAGDGTPIIVSSRTGALVAAAAPARRGDRLVLWTSGLGPTAPGAGTGAPASGDTLSPTVAPMTLSFQAGGRVVQSPVEFSGLAPFFIGVYQVNAVIPQDAPTGTVTVQLVSDFGKSNTVQVPIEN